MKIAAAQIHTDDDDLEANLASHYRLIEIAANKQVRLIVFPEMSLTGYHREKADGLSFTLDDERLDKLKILAASKNIIVVAGAPIKINLQLHIGCFILLPDGRTLVYTKQFLHSGEELFFTPSFEFNPILEVENEKISFAICADISHAAHAENASLKGTTLYIASIFYTRNGIKKGHEDLSSYSRKHAMKILMANYTGQSYTLDAGGRSAYWANTGKIITRLDKEEDMLIIETCPDE